MVKEQPIMTPKQFIAVRNIFVEFIGTLALVYFTNWINVLQEMGIVTFASYGIVYGLLLSILIYIGIGTSGAHFNPAVTVTNKFPKLKR